MARAKKKPSFNSTKVSQELLRRVSDYYRELAGENGDNVAFKYVMQTAEEFNVTPMKMRKLLITAGVYSTVTSEIVANLHAEGKSVQEIQEITGLKKSSINGYLPYSKVIYNQSEKSVGADRIGLYRKRNGLITMLQKDLSDEALWDCIIAHQGFLFHTSSGLPFKYSVKIGRNGQYTKELIIDRREESKTLSWSSIVLAFKNAVNFEGVAAKPKELGDIRGISYIYSMFYHFGLISVPDAVRVKMNGKNPKRRNKVTHEGGVEQMDFGGTMGIKYIAVVDILQQIEPGKVITEKILQKWLSSSYGIDNLNINWREFPYPHLRDDNIPFHRLLSARGLVDGYYKDKLIAEGHEVIETSSGKLQILDYKEAMVDVDMLKVPDQNIAVGSESNFIENINDEMKAFLKEKAGL